MQNLEINKFRHTVYSHEIFLATWTTSNGYSQLFILHDTQHIQVHKIKILRITVDHHYDHHVINFHLSVNLTDVAVIGTEQVTYTARDGQRIIHHYNTIGG